MLRRHQPAATAISRPATQAERGVVMLAGWLLLAHAVVSALWGAQ
jgi:hypothetical protein